MEQDQNVYQQGTGNIYPEPHRGTMILIFGILGILCCGIFAILAWIFGDTDLKKMQNGIMDPAGREQTNIGKILGIVGVCLWVLGTFGYFIIYGLAALSSF